MEFVETDGGNLEAEYHIVSKPEIISEEDVKGDLFEAVFQNIIVDIIKEAVEDYEQYDILLLNYHHLSLQTLPIFLSF